MHVTTDAVDTPRPDDNIVHYEGTAAAVDG